MSKLKRPLLSSGYSGTSWNSHVSYKRSQKSKSNSLCFLRLFVTFRLFQNFRLSDSQRESNIFWGESRPEKADHWSFNRQSRLWEGDRTDEESGLSSTWGESSLHPLSFTLPPGIKINLQVNILKNFDPRWNWKLLRVFRSSAGFHSVLSNA